MDSSSPAAHIENATPLSVGLQYIAAGMAVVVVSSPTSGGPGAGKAPKIMGWQKLRHSAEEFAEIMGKPKNHKCNLGVITGRASGVVCVDLDGDRGLAWYQEHQDGLGYHVTERRGDKSMHLWFRYPKDMDNLPSRVGFVKGVDILADGGHQVVTWPSVHRYGDQYRFDNGLSLLDVLAGEADELPAWLVQELMGKAPPPLATPSVDGMNLIEGIEAPLVDVVRVREILSNAFPRAVQGQSGDATTFRAACLCRDFGLSFDQAVTALREVYNPRCSPPWHESELRRKVENAYRYGKGDFGSKSAAAGFPVVAADAVVEPELRQKFYDLKRPLPCTDLFIERQAGRVLCDKSQLYVYSDHARCWQPIREKEFMAVIMRDIEASDAGVTLSKVKLQHLTSMVQLVRTRLEGRTPNIRPGMWRDGTPAQIVSLRSGLLDLATGELLDHTPDYFNFTTLPFDYDPNATCPRFEAFLEQIWEGDKELVHQFRLWAGYCLLNDMRAQKFAVLIGESRSGKSTLARVLEALIGHDNTAACSLALFGERFGLEPVLGKRLAIFNDVQSKSREAQTACERIISIVGNDPQQIDRKNQDALNLFLPLKIVFICNEFPELVNSRSALTNRMLVFPFKRSFVGQEDPNLLGSLLAEMSGVLNWALEGARAIIGGERFRQAKRGLEAIQDIQESLNTVSGFISEHVRVVPDDGQSVTIDKLFRDYVKYCEDAHSRPMKRQDFVQEFGSQLKGRAHRKVRQIDQRLVGFSHVVVDMDSMRAERADHSDGHDGLPNI
jgi:P4 family phage/plasmid primase-like protien